MTEDSYEVVETKDSKRIEIKQWHIVTFKAPICKLK
jgi:hypothetical protein